MAPFLSMLVESSTTEKAMLCFHEGKIENVPVVVLFSGVCKVNAAIATQILIDHFQCEIIVNAGTAGGMAPSIKIFDLVVCTKTAYHDVADHILTELHPWLTSAYFEADPQLLHMADQTARLMKMDHAIHFGTMVTGECFIEDDQRDRINRIYAPLSVDMETASIAHVCYVNQKPFVAIRAITDAADHSGAADFELNCAKASQLSADFVRKMLLLSGWGGEHEV